MLILRKLSTSHFLRDFSASPKAKNQILAKANVELSSTRWASRYWDARIRLKPFLQSLQACGVQQSSPFSPTEKCAAFTSAAQFSKSALPRKPLQVQRGLFLGKRVQARKLRAGLLSHVPAFPFLNPILRDFPSISAKDRSFTARSFEHFPGSKSHRTQ